MKLAKKIFLCIYMPTILGLITISYILIINNYQREKDLIIKISLQEMTTINNSIEKSNINEKYNTLQILKANKNYFSKKNIDFGLYKYDILKYNSSNEFQLNNKELLNIIDNRIPTIVEIHNKKHYLFATFYLKDETLIYKKSIESVYSNMYKNIKISIYVLFIFNIFVIIVSYILSKYITNPLKKLDNEMEKISNGNYNIKLEERKDELGKLAHNFNNMAYSIKENIDNKQIFIENLAHEMNTPLTSIKGYAEAIEKFDISIDDKNKYLKYIQDESTRIKDMYKKLLILAYNDNIEFKIIDFNKIITDLKIDLKDKLNNHNLIIKNSCNYFLGDEILFSICLSNLIRNAINNSSNNTNIIINTYELGNYKYIEVIDEGIGISKENINKIFEPFYRIDKNRSRNNGGSGLGLSLVKNIIDKHNGKIYVESELNRGSKFIIQLKKDN